MKGSLWSPNAARLVRPQLIVTGGVAAFASTFLTIATGPVAAQDIELSAVAAGFGGFVINGQAANEQAGRSVSSAGDVNGDGLADVIVGATFADPVAGPDAGRSYVVFGKVGGAEIQLSAIDKGVGGFVINGQAADDWSGYSVSSAGDVNGDGLADVIVGAIRSVPAAGSRAGRSYVVFGKTNGADVELLAVDNGTGGFVINGQASNDYSGFSVSSAGDVNGDGLADVIVGAVFSDPAAGANAGRSYVVFGKTGGGDVNLSAVDNGLGGFVINGQSGNDNAGFSVSSAGDVNGDGLADVIVGARYGTPAAGPFAGRSYVVFGKTAVGDVNLSAVEIGVGGFVINGQANADNSGISVSSAGDVNGDGLADVIVGAWRSNPAAGSDAGRSYVVFGKSDGANVDLSTIDNGVGGFVINGQNPYDRSGFCVSSAGDVNGDGLADVIVGARYGDSAAGSEAGRSYVVFGKTNGVDVDLSAVDNGTGGFVINGQAAGDLSGSSLSSAGDVNGDGLVDLIVGARTSDPAGASNGGRSYVIFSPISPATTGTYRAILAAGDPDRQGVGTHRFGDDATIFPDSRAWLDFDAGTLGSATVALRRDDNGLGSVSPIQTANVQWHVSTSRTGWGSVAVTVRYTDAEIMELNEGSLSLLSASTAAGPFVAVPGATLNVARNEFTGSVSSLPRVFIIADVGAPTVEVVNLDQNPSSADVADFLVSFSEPVAPSFTAADVTINGTLGSSSVIEIINNDPLYVVRVIARPLATDGELGITIGSGVSDRAGQALSPTSSSLYTIRRPGLILGDVNLDRNVNVSDVTALANSIVNGTPLP